MSKSQVVLRITLKSDLCAGSGEGFSSGIDEDVCFDRRGLPVIPGRRIKGCLREAAELIRCVRAKEIFGSPGSEVAGSIRIGNAVIVQGMQHVVPRDVQQTLSAYTTLRAMTAIDEMGGAKANTLRVVRVVRHYVAGEELVFEANVSIDEEYRAELERIALAMRNIGLMRNRGLGAIRCEVVSAQPDTGNAGDLDGVSHDEGEHQTVTISYLVKLEEPVMLPRDNGNRGTDCISGTSVLGCFASHLKDSPNFDELFLKGNVCFSPLYPVDDQGMRCMPAPSFVAKVKGGADDGLHRSVYDGCADGLLKPLKAGFVGQDWLPVNVQTETIYHHSRQGEGTLYTQCCLSAGQVFAGFIECVDCDSALIDELRSVLAGGTLSFGRSKSAQYALCRVTGSHADYSRRDKVSIKPGGKYALVLDSDLLLRDDRGCYVTEFALLKAGIEQALCDVADGIKIDIESEVGGSPHPVTSIKTCEVSGYNAKWNQKKPHLRAFAAGSTIAFRVPDEVDARDVPSVYCVGDRLAEGYGRLVLVSLDDVVIKERHQQDAREAERPAPEAERMRRETIKLARCNGSKVLTPSLVGRLALMVRESADEDDLRWRFDSIKNAERKRAAQGILTKVKEAGAVGDSDMGWPLLKECLSLYLVMLRRVGKQSGEGPVSE